MSNYLFERPDRELVPVSARIASDIPLIPSSTWSVSCMCGAEDEEPGYVCPECAQAKARSTTAPRRRWFGRKESRG
jgi:hypothetical protein